MTGSTVFQIASMCKTEISPSIIKEILDEDAFERWERLTFQVES
jgi:hypothetical protein